MKKFYYVHNRAQGNPTHRHLTYESAVEEAKRLCQLHKKNFYVVESVSKVFYCYSKNEPIVDNQIEEKREDDRIVI